VDFNAVGGVDNKKITISVNMADIVINVIRDDVVEEPEEPEPYYRHKFIFQVFITLLVIAGAILGIMTSDEPWGYKDIYIAIISALVSLYIPSPKAFN
jgi:hypothetical protein